jgi:hypothetical protein
MTKDKDEKAVVRARMARTGESYAAARAQLQRPAPITLQDLPAGMPVRAVPPAWPACSFCRQAVDRPVIAGVVDEANPSPAHICAACATLAAAILAEEHDSRAVLGRDAEGRAMSCAPEEHAHHLPELVRSTVELRERQRRQAEGRPEPGT